MQCFNSDDQAQLIVDEEKEHQERNVNFEQNRYIFDREELKSSKMHLIDFGSSYSYLDKEGNHIKNIE